MTRWATRLVIAAVAVALALPAAAQEALKGVALVIGQSDYENLTELNNPKNDALAMYELLDGLGFDVKPVLDADAEDLAEELEEFAEDAAEADVALIYYSGHGIEAGGENYLIPVDADVSTPQKAGESLVALSSVLDKLRRTVDVTIFLLDACRSNSFPRGQTIVLPDTNVAIPVSPEGLALARGDLLAGPTANPDQGLGTVIGFAAAPGQVALDGDPGGNSPYAAALLKHLGAGEYSIGDLMTLVSEEVYLETDGRQLPWANSSLRRILYFGEQVEETEGDEALIRQGRRNLLLSVAKEPVHTRTVVESVAASENVPLDALYGMLKVLGVDTSGGAADLEKQLRDGASRVRTFMEDQPGTAKTDAELIRLSDLADRSQDEGAMDVALHFRELATARALELSALRDQDENAIREDRLEIAETFADHAETAALVFEFATAEQLFLEAYRQVERWDDEKALEYRARLASTRYWRGEKEGDVSLIEAAIADYQAALALAPRETRPNEWVFIQRGMALAQTTLAIWTNDAAAFGGVVNTYNALLSALPEDEVLQRAFIYNNLGVALLTIGLSRDDSTLMERSLQALLEAKRLLPSPDIVPMLNSSIGVALGSIGAARHDPTTLEAAATIIEATIKEDLSQPLDVAKAQSNLGIVLTALGRVTNDPDPTRRAVDLLLAALKVQQREIAPQDWAKIHVNLGESLRMLGAHYQDARLLSQSLIAYDNALLEFDHDTMPGRWAVTMRDRAYAVETIGRLESDPALLEEAVATYRSILPYLSFAAAPGEWVKTQNTLVLALTRLASLTHEQRYLHDAIAVMEEIGGHVTREVNPDDWASNQQQLANLYNSVHLEGGGVEWLAQARDAYRRSLEVVTPDYDEFWWTTTQMELIRTLMTLGYKASDVAALDDARAVALEVLALAAARGNRPLLVELRGLLNDIASHRAAVAGTP